jgi:hypothetical protein
MTPKSGKKLTGADILLAVNTNTPDFGMLNPNELLNTVEYQKNFIYLEVLTCLMGTPTFERTTRKDGKPKLNPIPEPPPTINSNGIFFKNFGISIDTGRQIFDYKKYRPNKEVSKPIFGNWWKDEPSTHRHIKNEVKGKKGPANGKGHVAVKDEKGDDKMDTNE